MKVMSKTKEGPWWKHKYVWLIISGPLLVVIASIITAYLAITRPDAVIEDYYNKGIHINDTLKNKDASMLPAIQGRNVAALPKEKDK
jgi:uncharacterized protein